MHGCIYNQPQCASASVIVCDKDEGIGKKVVRRKSETPDFLDNVRGVSLAWTTLSAKSCLPGSLGSWVPWVQTGRHCPGSAGSLLGPCPISQVSGASLHFPCPQPVQRDLGRFLYSTLALNCSLQKDKGTKKQENVCPIWTLHHVWEWSFPLPIIKHKLTLLHIPTMLCLA